MWHILAGIANNYSLLTDVSLPLGGGGDNLDTFYGTHGLIAVINTQRKHFAISCRVAESLNWRNWKDTHNSRHYQGTLWYTPSLGATKSIAYHLAILSHHIAFLAPQNQATLPGTTNWLIARLETPKRFQTPTRLWVIRVPPKTVSRIVGELLNIHKLSLLAASSLSLESSHSISLAHTLKTELERGKRAAGSGERGVADRSPKWDLLIGQGQLHRKSMENPSKCAHCIEDCN